MPNVHWGSFIAGALLVLVAQFLLQQRRRITAG